jgi:hypothetical protein
MKLFQSNFKGASLFQLTFTAKSLLLGLVCEPPDYMKQVLS